MSQSYSDRCCHRRSYCCLHSSCYCHCRYYWSHPNCYLYLTSHSKRMNRRTMSHQRRRTSLTMMMHRLRMMRRWRMNRQRNCCSHQRNSNYYRRQQTMMTNRRWMSSKSLSTIRHSSMSLLSRRHHLMTTTHSRLMTTTMTTLSTSQSMNSYRMNSIHLSMQCRSMKNWSRMRKQLCLMMTMMTIQSNLGLNSTQVRYLNYSNYYLDRMHATSEKRRRQRRGRGCMLE